MPAAFVDTPFGPVSLRSSMINGSEALIALDFSRSSAVSDAPDGSGPMSPLLDEAAAQLMAYCQGKLTRFDVPLFMEGTPFQREIWEALKNIPYGETCTYGELAAATGRPSAARAVGGACRCNPVAIIVPCHRVVGAGGKLVGYAGGLELKRKLLSFEKEVKSRIFSSKV